MPQLATLDGSIADETRTSSSRAICIPSRMVPVRRPPGRADFSVPISMNKPTLTVAFYPAGRFGAGVRITCSIKTPKTTKSGHVAYTGVLPCLSKQHTRDAFHPRPLTTMSKGSLDRPCSRSSLQRQRIPAPDAHPNARPFTSMSLADRRPGTPGRCRRGVRIAPGIQAPPSELIGSFGTLPEIRFAWYSQFLQRAHDRANRTSCCQAVSSAPAQV